MDRKRFILLIVFIVVALGLGFLMYKVFFAKPKPTTLPSDLTGVTPGTPGQFPSAGTGERQPGATTGPGALPTAQGLPTDSFRPAAPEQKEVKIVDSSVVSPAVTDSGNVQYYDKRDGKFYRVGADGNPQPLSDEVFFNVDNVVWSPNEFESIIEYPDGSNIYYNFKDQKQVTLPKHWEDFSFATDGDQIAAKSVGLSSENRWLVASDPDGGNIQFIEHLGENQNKVNVDWSPNKQIVALSRTGEALGSDREEVLLIGKNKENFRSLVVEGRGLKSTWSEEGQQLLYSVYSTRSDFKPELWIVDAAPGSIGANRRPLQIGTWADKCTFQGERYVYCGVPTRLETGTGFQPAIADTVPDILVRVDTQTGAKTQIPLDDTHTIDSLFISEDGQTLHFTDKNQTGIFRVDL